ncbi:MAG: reductive dehalogenase [Candidatus Heimdallarchaeota archaeon]|nr:reductive dehalogenase [Candidatus Heimdallarchaeota archaeon]
MIESSKAKITSYCVGCKKCIEVCPLNAISVVEHQKFNEIVLEKNKEVIQKWKSSDYLIDTDRFTRFSQTKSIFSRVNNDPSFKNYKEGIYTFHNEILRENKKGYSRIEMALSSSAWAVYDNLPAAFPNHQTKIDPEQKFDVDLIPDKEFYKNDDPENMARIIKQVATAFGAAEVGITKINPNWIYTHNRQGNEVSLDEDINYAIVMLIEMDLEALQTSPALPSGFATGNGYSRMAFAQACMAAFLRDLGYKAVPDGNGTALSVPLAIDAGLGQYGRHGLLITEKYGSNVRICKVLTNLPLATDKPKQFGVLEFCRTCKTCADTCPSQSISQADIPSWNGPTISNNPGILKWYVNVETCYDFWTRNGGDCNNCVANCPFTQSKHWSHGIPRFFIRNAPIFNRLWVWLHHLIYGKQRKPEDFWEDDKKFIHTR